MERHWRVYHPALPEDEEATVELSSAESHHVQRVLRLGDGDALHLFDGQGRQRAGTIVGRGSGPVRVRLLPEEPASVEAPIGVVLFQSLCRADRMEWVIQKATELGLSAVCPFPAERSDARAPSPSRLERWRRIAIEACKQCGRSRVPGVEMREELPEPPADRSAIILHGAEDAHELGELLSGPPEDEIWIAVGPESGFTPDEIRRWTERGWRSGRLGPRTLRTETAGLVAAAIVMHRWGDLGRVREPGGPAGHES